MSAKKLLMRINAAEGNAVDQDAKKEAHFQTYGIKSDPLAQFAIVFSALIHDVSLLLGSIYFRLLCHIKISDMIHFCFHLFLTSFRWTIQE